MKASRGALVLVFLLLFPGFQASAQEWAGQGRIEGLVVDEDGDPVPGAQVVLSWRGIVDYPPRSLEEEKLLDERGPEPLVSDDQGRWTRAALRSGVWKVEVQHLGYGRATGSVRVHSIHSHNRRGRLLRVVLPGTRAGAIRLLLESGEGLLAAGHPSEARGQLQAALPLLSDSDRSVVLGTIARTHYLEQDLPAALVRLREAVELDPRNAEARQVLVELLLGDGKAEAALEAAEEFVRQHPELPEAHLQEARAHLALRQVDRARESLQDVLRLQETGPVADQAHRLLAAISPPSVVQR